MPYLLLLFLWTPFSAQAEIFQWVDTNGNQHFSDRPRQDAGILEINPGHTYYQVKKVYDGDTILLANDKKVRFLGINTPEVEGLKQVEVGGEEAKHWLQKKIENKKVRLEKDFEKQDKYGRLLAHIFTKDKEHINLELVKQGLATVNIHPPNLKYADELLKMQQVAEESHLGIWGYNEYAVKKVSQIKNSSFRGWQRVVGHLINVRHVRKYSYLNFNDIFALKIATKSKKLFPDLQSYIGKKVEVRGWISKHENRYSMFIRHPSAIITLDN